MNYNNRRFKGLLFIGFAILMFLSSQNYFHRNIFIELLTYSLILYGLYKVVTKEFFGGFFIVAITLKLFPTPFLSFISLHRIGWFYLMFMTFILATGFEMLFSNKYKWKVNYNKGKFKSATFSNQKSKEDVGGEFVNISHMMGEYTKYIDTKDLKQASLENKFGQLTAYFINEEIKNDVYINLNCKFGNIELYLPKNWDVVSDISVVFGDVDIKENFANSPFKVYIQGDVSFGNVDIYFV